MVSPGVVAALSMLGIVLLVAPMLGLALIGARTESGTPPAARDEPE